MTPPDGNFSVNSSSPMTVTVASATEVDVFFFGGVSPAAGWMLSGQPNWLLTTAIIPEDGTVA